MFNRSCIQYSTIIIIQRYTDHMSGIIILETETTSFGKLISNPLEYIEADRKKRRGAHRHQPRRMSEMQNTILDLKTFLSLDMHNSLLSFDIYIFNLFSQPFLAPFLWTPIFTTNAVFEAYYFLKGWLVWSISKRC